MQCFPHLGFWFLVFGFWLFVIRVRLSLSTLLLSHLCAVDDEGEVVADVALHVLDALAQLDVLVVPAHGAGGQGDDSARESRRVALDGEGGDGFDHESGWKDKMNSC